MSAGQLKAVRLLWVGWQAPPAGQPAGCRPLQRIACVAASAAMREMQQHLPEGQPAHCKLRTASQAPCWTHACTSFLVQEVGQDELEGTVLWKEQLCLERVRLRSTSQVVVEVHHQKEGSFEPEMIAWAHAPIMQVGRCSWADTTRCSTTSRALSSLSRLPGLTRPSCR